VIRSEPGKIHHGIIGSKPPHLTSLNERKKIVEISDMYIDVGMDSKEEVVKNNINIGTTGTLFSP
jgi:putative aminopeptidase FrvX